MGIFLILRHGNTDWNDFELLTCSDMGLNNNGIYRTKDLCKELPQYEWNLIISSPAKRAIQTAQILSHHFNIPVKLVSDIDERKHGFLLGKREGADMLLANYGGREDVRFFLRRCVSFFSKLSTDYYDKNVIVVTHGGVLKVFSKFFFNEKKRWNNLEWKYYEELPF